MNNPETEYNNNPIKEEEGMNYYHTSPNFEGFSANIEEDNQFGQYIPENKWTNIKRETNLENKKILQAILMNNQMNNQIDYRNYNPSIQNYSYNKEDQHIKEQNPELKYQIMNNNPMINQFEMKLPTNPNQMNLPKSQNQMNKKSPNYLEEKEKLFSFNPNEILRAKDNNINFFNEGESNFQPKTMNQNSGSPLIKNIQYTSNYSINDMKIVANAENLLREQNGCRFVQEKINSSPKFANEILFPYLCKSDQLINLISDQFGNYFFQAMLLILTNENFENFLRIISKDIFKVSISPYGTRVLQVVLELISKNEKYQDILMDAFKQVNMVVVTQDP